MMDVDKVVPIAHKIITFVLFVVLFIGSWQYTHKEREYNITRAVTVISLMDGDSCANIAELINSPSGNIEPNMMHAMMDGVQVVSDTNDCKFIVKGETDENL